MSTQPLPQLPDRGAAARPRSGRGDADPDARATRRARWWGSGIRVRRMEGDSPQLPQWIEVIITDSVQVVNQAVNTMARRSRNTNPGKGRERFSRPFLVLGLLFALAAGCEPPHDLAEVYAKERPGDRATFCGGPGDGLRERGPA